MADDTKHVQVAQVQTKGGRRSRKMEYLLDLYKAEHPDEDVVTEPHRIAAWAVERGLWQRPPMAPEEVLRREIARYLKNQYFVDPQGREVRANHAVIIEIETPAGAKMRRSRWMPLFEATPEHMLTSAQLRRRGVVADVVQLDRDLQSYNENNVHGATLPEMSFDMTADVAESRLPETYPAAAPENDDEEDDEIDEV